MNERLSPRDWGKGIPKYTDKDLMTKEEIHDFGCQIVADQLKKQGYRIHHYNPNYGVFPSIIAENDKEVVAVEVLTDVAPKQPKMPSSDKYGLLSFSLVFDTIPAFASVSIGAVDSERFDKSLALAGDAFYANYKGLEYIDKKVPEINTKEYRAFLIKYLSMFLYGGKYDVIKEYVANECIIKNTIDHTEHTNALEYLKECFDKQPIIGHETIISDGDYRNFKIVNDIVVKDEKIKGPINAKIWQEPDKINLLLKTAKPLFNNDDTGLIFNIDYNDKGKINKIEIIDPRLYGFKHFEE